MKNIYSVLLMAFIFQTVNSYAQAPDWMWAKSIGSTGNDIGHAVAVDDSGNIFIAGSYEGTVDFDPGPGLYNLTCAGILDAFLLKLDSSGNFLWVQSIGGTQSEISNALAVDAGGNVYWTGRFGSTVDFDPGPGVNNITAAGGNYDLFITKYTGSGNYQWAEVMTGQGDDQCLSLELDTAGNIYGTGYFSGTHDFDPGTAVYYLTSNGNQDAFVFKLENSGGFIWAKSFGGVLGEAGISLALDAISNIYVTGYFNGTIDMDPGSGVYMSVPAGANDIYITKLTESGNFIWSKSMGGSQQDLGRSLFSDAAGNIYSSGNYLGTADFDPGVPYLSLSSMGNADIFTSKLTAQGDYVWAKTVGGTYIDNNYDMAADAAGNIYTTGYFQSTVDFDPGSGVFNLVSGLNNAGFISKLDSAGNFIWAKQFNGQYSEIGRSIAIDNSNHLYITGSYMSATLNMDADTLVNTVGGGATADIFIAKLDTGFINTGMPTIAGTTELQVFPNPATDFLIISYPLSTNNSIRVTLTDIAGKVVYESEFKHDQKLVVDTGILAGGLYFIQVKSMDYIASGKIILNK